MVRKTELAMLISPLVSTNGVLVTTKVAAVSTSVYAGPKDKL